MRGKNSTPLNLALAAGIGVAAGILLAPRRGKDTRDQIKHKAVQARINVMDKLVKERNMLKEQAGKAQHKASNAVGTVQKKVVETQEAAKEKVGEIKARADQKQFVEARRQSKSDA